MAINFDNALGIHQNALKVRSARSAILANNLANADTPGFQAKDIDFKQVLKGQVQLSQNSTSMKVTNEKHFQNITNAQPFDTLYRIPQQPSIDGNTVEEQVEHAEFMKNSLAFQSSFSFLNSKFKGLVTAIKGE